MLTGLYRASSGDYARHACHFDVMRDGVGYWGVDLRSRRCNVFHETEMTWQFGNLRLGCGQYHDDCWILYWPEMNGIKFNVARLTAVML
jgi:hypothetical protein